MKIESGRDIGNTEFPVYASRIKDARRYVGCKTEDAANLLGISKHEYSEIESRRSILNRSKLEKLAQLYCRPFQYFICEEKRSKPEFKFITISDTTISEKDDELSQHDSKELLKFAEFLSAVPKKQLRNGNNPNILRDLIQIKNRKNGVKSASELLRKIGLAVDNENVFQVDIFKVIRETGMLLLFRPMKNLLGATVLLGDRAGIILNSELPLVTQRFVAACQLGQHLIGEDRNLNSVQLFKRSQLGKVLGNSKLVQKARTVQESASCLLLPKSLIFALMKMQGWKKKSMTEPGIVYQAALRTGTNFHIMIHGLARENLISKAYQSKLEKCNLESLKRKLLDGKTFTESLNSFNVWHFTERDNGLVFEAELNDIFLFEFMETPSTGFVWNFDELDRDDFSIIDNSRIPISKKTVGSPVRRRVLVKANKSFPMQELLLQNKQSWAGGELGDTMTFHCQINPDRKQFKLNTSI